MCPFMLGALVLFPQHKHLRTHHPIQWHQVMYRPIYRLWHQTLTQMFFPQQRKLGVFSHSKGSGAGRSSQIRWEPGSQEGSQEEFPFTSGSLGAAKSVWRKVGNRVPRKRFPSKVSQQGSQQEVPKQSSQEQVPKQGSQARFPSKVPNNRFPSKVPRKRLLARGSQARFPGRGSKQGSQARLLGKVTRNRFPSKGSQEQVPKQGSQEQVARNRFPSKGS